MNYAGMFGEILFLIIELWSMCDGMIRELLMNYEGIMRESLTNEMGKYYGIIAASWRHHEAIYYGIHQDSFWNY